MLEENTKVYHLTHNSPLMEPILSQLNPVHSLPHFTIRSTLILSSHLLGTQIIRKIFQTWGSIFGGYEWRQYLSSVTTQKTTIDIFAAVRTSALRFSQRIHLSVDT
jgi:hypothetical protein